jgi:PLP dependent protein
MRGLVSILFVTANSRFSRAYTRGFGVQRAFFHNSMSDFAASDTAGTVADVGGSCNERKLEVQANLLGVKNKLEAAVGGCGRDVSSVNLIAVSKTKPASDIMALYNAGQRDFGENYFQELLGKVEELPDDIRWHFIGHLQSAKAGPLVKGVPNLASIETVDTPKLASKLNTAAGSYRTEDNPLHICLQVDTSGEDSKSGVTLSEVCALATHVKDTCPNLRVLGLMTIGAPGDSSCFDRLVEARVDAAAALGVEADSLQLSMGMSGDFEAAIAKGSTRVRIGSTLFGKRDYIGSKPSST